MLDHLVFAAPDLQGAVDDFSARTGVSPAPGGSHTGWGTANHLVGLGGGAYLEIVGPDPAQPEPEGPRPFGIDALAEGRLVTWALRPDDLDAVITAARARGYDPGEASAMSRRTLDGELLEWRLTPALLAGDGLVPFLIDWGSTPHPTTRELPTVRLAQLTLSYPDPDQVRGTLATLGVDDAVRTGPAGLAAALDTPHGLIRL